MLCVATASAITSAIHNVSGVAAASAVRNVSDKPNFVMLFVDDLGYGDVGFNGHPTTHTPRLDQLASAGRVMTTWYSAAPVCSASRASLLTGRQWARMGIDPVFSPTTAAGLPLNESTLATLLRGAGYATGAVGKWHLVSALGLEPHDLLVPHELLLTRSRPSAARDSAPPTFLPLEASIPTLAFHTATTKAKLEPPRVATSQRMAEQTHLI